MPCGRRGAVSRKGGGKPGVVPQSVFHPVSGRRRGDFFRFHTRTRRRQTCAGRFAPQTDLCAGGILAANRFVPGVPVADEFIPEDLPADGFVQEVLQGKGSD